MKHFILFVLKTYQRVVSPFLGRHCRFYPSCSHYSEEAFRELPLAQAFYFSLKRILRCHPFSEGGPDPLPQRTIR